jgi:hypothetical protein
VLNGLPMDPNALLLAQQGAVAVPGGPPVATDASGVPAVVPYESTTVRGPSTDVRNETTKTVPTPEIVTAQGKVGSAADALRSAEVAKADRNVKVEGIEADAAKDEAQARADRLKEREDLKRNTDKQIADLMAGQKIARDELLATKQGSYLDDMSMPRRFLQALSLAAGTFASAYGAQNTALEIYKANEEAYRHKKENEIQAKAKSVLAYTGDIKAARDAMTDGQAEILNRENAQLATLKAQTQAHIKRVPQARVAGEEAIAKLDMELAQNELKQANLFAEKVSNGSTQQGAQVSTTTVTGTKPGDAAGPKLPGMSDAEAKKAMYGTQILDAVKKIKSLPEPSDDDLRQFNRNAMGMRAAAENSTKGLTGPLRVAALRAFGVSPESLVEGIKDPRVQETLLNYAVAGGLIIRDQSGAAITNAEDINNAMQRLPQAGEARQVKRGKLDSVEKNGQLMLQLAGPGAAARLALPTPGATQPAPAIATPAPSQSVAPSAPAAQPAPRKAPRFTAEQSKDYEKLSRIYQTYQKTDPERAAKARELMRSLRREIGGE